MTEQEMLNQAMPGYRIAQLDDTFQFSCTTCGKCCKHREDILLNPKDIFSISKALDMEPHEMIKKYCDVYIGHNSHMPLVRILPRGNVKRCPFLSGGKCLVHEGKPSVCALYPVGRYATYPTDESSEIKIRYILPPKTDCGNLLNPETHTIRDWLKSFNIPEEDEFLILWTEQTAKAFKLFTEIEKHMSKDTLVMMSNIFYSIVYCEYDIHSSQPFMEQFKEQMKKLNDIYLGLNIFKRLFNKPEDSKPEDSQEHQS